MLEGWEEEDGSAGAEATLCLSALDGFVFRIHFARVDCWYELVPTGRSVRYILCIKRRGNLNCNVWFLSANRGVEHYPREMR